MSVSVIAMSLVLLQAPVAAPPTTESSPKTGKTRRQLILETKSDPERVEQFRLDSALMIAGGAVMGVGFATAGVGVAFYPIEAFTENPPPVSTRLLISGGVVGGLGLLLLTVGSVRRLNLIHEKEFVVSPSLGLAYGGVRASFRF